MMQDDAPETKPRSSLPAKYRNPENEAETWTGRGHRPKWLKAALAAGAALERFAVNLNGEARE
jgi:DNA-binding protein H-NS